MSNTATSTPETGQILAGKYLVEQVLGIGGMGVVVAAKHIQLDQKVAIKYLLPAALLNPEVVERFAREARAAAKIRGEHVARVIDVGQFDDGAPYMIMEHLEGHDLAKHLELHGPLPFEDAVRYLLETCEALAEAHAAKIVHRDLKPSNMFLATQPDRSTIIKVLDFGISKTGDAPAAALTKTSALMGTCFYMSPEQLTNPKGVDHRSDIWSLGIILYELLSGRQPFLGESVPEIIGGILSNEPEPLKTLRADVPFGLEVVIGRCMQTKPADRYQSVAQLAAALGPFANARDRQSIETTARVLGESLRPPQATLPSGNTDAGKATMLGSSSPNAQTGPTLPPITNATSEEAPPASAAAPVVPQTMTSGVAPATGPAVAAVTTHGMSTSAITEKPKRSPVPMIAAGAVLVLAIGGGLFAMKGKGASTDTPPAPASTGLVAAPATQAAPADPPAAAPTGTTTLLPAAAAAAPAPDPSPAAQATNVAAPRVSPTPRASASAAAPVKSGAPVATGAPTAPAATQAAAPASSTKSNPLQMGIK
jgi:eukaryotic-like serine/threonine-protein kinase